MLKLKITGKLLSGIYSIIILTIFVGYIGYKGVMDIAGNLDDIETNSLPSIQAVSNIQFSLWTIKTSMRSLCILNLPQDIIDDQFRYFDEARAEIKKQWSLYDPIDKIMEERESWNNFKNIYPRINSKIDEFILTAKEYHTSIKSNSNNASLLFDKLKSQGLGDIRNDFHDIDQSIKLLININTREAGESHDNSSQVVSYSKTMIIIFTIIAAIIAYIIGTFISLKFIKGPINGIISIFEKVTSGDLRSRSEIKTNDEFQTLSEFLNKMIEQRRKEVQELLEKSKILNSSSGELLNISSTIASSSEELVAQTTTASTGGEQVSANVNSVSTAAEEMTSSIREISKNTTTASKISDEAQRKASQANEVMSRLGVSSTEIGSIVKVITSIAEQTNLLALNATIEAARAGELGKGFAVVANEVKELAKESAKATEDISGRIKLIQADSNNAIEVIKDITEINHQVNDITNTIASAVEEQTVTVNEVTRNLSEASTGVNSISESITGISTSAHEFSSLAHNLKSSADNLQHLAKSIADNLNSTYKL